MVEIIFEAMIVLDATMRILTKKIKHGPWSAFLVQNPYTDKNPHQLRFRWSESIPADDQKYWENQEYFFIQIPKTASCSIAWSIPIQVRFGHMFGQYYPEKIRHKLRTIVRNPYDRLVSAYCFMIRGGFNNNKEYLRIRDNYDSFGDWVLSELSENQVKFSPRFSWRQNGWAEPLIQQKQWITDENGELIIDPKNIGRFENLHEEVQRLFMIELRCHYNKTQREPWQNYYRNQWVAEKVYRLYREDFELFGYQKEIS